MPNQKQPTSPEEAQQIVEEKQVQAPSENEKKEKPSVLKEFPKKGSDKNTLFLILGSILVVLAGVTTGYFLSGRVLGSSSEASQEIVTSKEETQMGEGIEDEETFSDSEEGILQSGGMNGEGTHHLDRGLGETKHVYLTSTVIDLEAFVGKKVKVWGQTFAARKAGYFMDVGKIKVVE